MLGVGGGGQHGVMAVGMEAKDHLGLGWLFEAEALRADRRAPIAADLDDGAHAPHMVPPRAAGCRPQDRAFFLAGLSPSPLRRLAQFALDFPGVAMRSQIIDLRIGDGNFGDLFGFLDVCNG